MNMIKRIALVIALMAVCMTSFATGSNESDKNVVVIPASSTLSAELDGRGLFPLKMPQTGIIDNAYFVSESGVASSDTDVVFITLFKNGTATMSYAANNLGTFTAQTPVEMTESVRWFDAGDVLHVGYEKKGAGQALVNPAVIIQYHNTTSR